MQLTAQEEYGIRCLVQVAQHARSHPLSIHSIAEREGLSPEYAAKLMRALRRAQLVASTRGAAGGYRLARPAAEISTWQVIESLGGSFFSDEFCESHPGQLRDCVHTPSCAIRGLWRSVEGAVRGVLERVSIADLTRSEGDLVTWIDTPKPEARPPS